MINEKYEKLIQYLKELGSVAVAFSSGVDSTFLLRTAHNVLGDKAIAITVRSLSFPQRELSEATAFAKQEGVRHIIVDSDELSIEGFSQNPANRCYLCKRELFSKMKDIALTEGIAYIIEGSNVDDDGDYRPGLLAIAELGIKSPLRQAGLTKAEIRQLSRKAGLSTWDKPSFACLASRFPYGERITPERLRMVEAAEQFLLDMGFRQVRVRFHGNVARIETEPDGFDAIMDAKARRQIYEKLKQIGFTYVAVDMQGYRTGSMNETLDL